MNYRKTLMIIGVTTLFTLGGASIAMAHSDFHGKGYNKGAQASCSERGGMRAMKHIDGLTDAQQAQLKDLAEAQRGQRQAQREQMRESRQAMHQAISQGTNTVSLDVLADQQAELYKQGVLFRAQQQQQMLAILNDEQRNQLMEMRQQRMERRQQ